MIKDSTSKSHELSSSVEMSSNHQSIGKKSKGVFTFGINSRKQKSGRESLNSFDIDEDENEMISQELMFLEEEEKI